MSTAVNITIINVSMDRPTPPAGLSLLVSKTIAARATAKDDHNNNKNDHEKDHNNDDKQ